MKRFDRLLIVVPLLILAVIAAADLILLRSSSSSRQYIVDANRIEQQILSGKMPSADDLQTVDAIVKNDGDEDFFRSDGEYLIREINGELYRIDYTDDKSSSNIGAVIALDAALAVLLVLIMAVLLYIRQNILKQFVRLNDVPYQLAKGNLSEPLKENKSRFFGKFVWGLDILRGELEQSKTNELERARKEKTMLLSLSHDIKTPLAAIKLYSKGLSRGLFGTEEKRLEAADCIGAKADEIEGYLARMIDSLNSDFMSFDVSVGDIYLSAVICRVTAYYKDKLSLTGTEFAVGEYDDCMLSADADRLEEVLQNIFENAIKYGDGRSISMTFADEEDCRLITVSNSGCTLTDAELDHIFDSFWRGSNAGSKQGSGLGLYICQRLMNEMGGDIFAEIENGNMNVTLVCKKIA
ncbi:Signal transduction histidine kinase [Ruminococcus sp. YRD2003]|uniref:sensor histidine kinase n=1 Tax=Ruminococcus sp. YRD2003 TaxID=1452313 RepID=UPI0008C141FE|nr:Signal transduction histidine kinase [Ruminococcus flavefaciens]